jgi:hypothetical protein
MGIKFGGISGGSGCGCCATGLGCGTCTIPLNNLTVHWTNPILGDGSATLTWNGASTSAGAAWDHTSCVNELTFHFACNAGALDFRAIYYISGSCPSGTSRYCGIGGGSGGSLTQTGLVCGDSFHLTLSCDPTHCNVLTANGFTSFEVTNP